MDLIDNFLISYYDHSINRAKNGAQSARVVTNLKEASELKAVGFPRL